MLRKIENAISPKSEYQFRPRTEVHIEHILPVTSTSFWSQRVNVAKGEVYDDIKQRWGNLTLLRMELNETIQNEDFDFKKKNNKEMDYARSQIRMTLDLLEFDDWNSETIDARQQWMGLLASKIWASRRLDEEGARPSQSR